MKLLVSAMQMSLLVPVVVQDVSMHPGSVMTMMIVRIGVMNYTVRPQEDPQENQALVQVEKVDHQEDPLENQALVQVEGTKLPVHWMSSLVDQDTVFLSH